MSGKKISKRTLRLAVLLVLVVAVAYIGVRLTQNKPQVQSTAVTETAAPLTLLTEAPQTPEPAGAWDTLNAAAAEVTAEQAAQPPVEAELPTAAETTTAAEASAEQEEPLQEELPVESGSYLEVEDVAYYLHTYGHLPDNYMTKSEAKKAGWVSSEGNLWEVSYGASIGGDKFKNKEGLLPADETYYECDVNYDGGPRGAERIIYTDDGDVWYTADHYETFEKLY